MELESCCVQIVYRLTCGDLGLPAGEGRKGRPTTGEEVAGCGESSECDESDGKAANMNLPVWVKRVNGPTIYQRAQVRFSLYRPRANDSVTRASRVS